MIKCLICNEELNKQETKSNKWACDKCKVKDNKTSLEKLLVAIFNPNKEVK